MDDPTHALMVKQCFTCHTWALLTQANWPEESLNDPKKSCCQKCHSQGTARQAGDPSKSVDGDCLKCLVPSTCPSESTKRDCVEMDTSDATWGSTSEVSIATPSKLGGITDTDVDVVESPLRGRSTMASRWAVKEAPQKVTSPASSMSEWFKLREDLFSGVATVKNASPKLFETMSTRNDKKVKGGNVKAMKDTVTTFNGREAPPHMSMGRHNVDQRARHRVTLTGANVTAGNGDNGWESRIGRRLNGDQAAVRSAGPSSTYYDQSKRERETTFAPSFWAEHQKESKGMLSQGKEEAPIEDCNEDLLESIARLQLRNVQLLKPSKRAYGDHDEPSWD